MMLLSVVVPVVSIEMLTLACLETGQQPTELPSPTIVELPPPPPAPLLTIPPPPAPPKTPPPRTTVPKSARPSNNPATWATDADYPHAFKNGEAGTTGFRLTIGLDGRPTGCEITQSSGYSLFDELTCRLLIRRARFHPATNAAGKPTKGSWSSRVRWKRPVTAPPVSS
jgi:periplasmic protein TonB